VSIQTATKYLCEFIEYKKPEHISRWIDDATYARIAEASKTSEDGRLKPIYEAMGGDVPYEQIRLVVIHLQVRAGMNARS